VHCLQECSSNPHFAHCPNGSETRLSSVPHWPQRETECVPGICTGRGPNVSFRTGFSAEGFWRSPPLSWYPCWRYLRSDKVSSLEQRMELNILSPARLEHKPRHPERTCWLLRP